MLCKKIKQILTVSEIIRLKEILRQESFKRENQECPVFNDIDSIGDTIYYEYFEMIIHFLKRYNGKRENTLTGNMSNCP